MKKNKILFAVSSLGLGHATRTLSVIKFFLDKQYQIDIISFWNALNYLKNELKEKKVNFIELQDYPPLERGSGIMFYFYLIFDLLKTKYLIKKEHNFVEKISKKYDFIISDWRYWVYSKKIPSYLISHQISFVMPEKLGFFQKISDLQNKKYFKKFNKILIPDFENKKNNLAWKLSHPSWINSINHSYIWILSDFFEKKEIKYNNEKIDFLFTITWYLQEHKKDFVEKLLNQAKKLPWKKVFILWDTSKKYIKKLENNIFLHSFVSGEEKKQLYKNAEIIISRTGYTTVMDLIELEKKAILFPTPNQTEQEYLAKYLEEKKYFIIWNKASELLDLVQKIKEIKWVNFENKTKKSLENIEKIVL